MMYGYFKDDSLRTSFLLFRHINFANPVYTDAIVCEHYNVPVEYETFRLFPKCMKSITCSAELNANIFFNRNLFPNLTRLNLDGNKIEFPSSSVSPLVYLNVNTITASNTVSFLEFITRVTTLTHLEMKGRIDDTNTDTREHLNTLLLSLPELQTLNLSNTTIFSNWLVPENNQSIGVRSLKLCDCSNINNTLGVIAQTWTKLQSLSLSRSIYEMDDLIVIVKSIPSLTELECESTGLTDAEKWNELQKETRNLVSLNLSHFYFVESEKMKWNGCDNLTSLQLLSCGLANDDILEISKLTKLRKLVVGKNEIIDSGVEALIKHPNLTYLDLRGCSMITDQGFCELPRNSKLTALDLFFCVRVSGEGWVEYMDQNNALRELNVGCTSVNDSFLIDISKNTSLHSLQLSGAQYVYDRGLSHLFQHNSTLQDLNLLETDMSDESAQYLIEENNSIRSLRLSRWLLSDETIVDLIRKTTISELFL